MLTTAYGEYLAQDSVPGIPDLFGTLASYGILGIFTLMLIFRIKVQPTYVMDDAKKAWDDEKIQLVEQHDEEIAILIDNCKREREQIQQAHTAETRLHEENRVRERTRLELENAELKASLKESTSVNMTQVIPMLTLVASKMESWVGIINRIDRNNGGGQDGRQ